jgi:hypothetical protein
MRVYKSLLFFYIKEVLLRLMPSEALTSFLKRKLLIIYSVKLRSGVDQARGELLRVLPLLWALIPLIILCLDNLLDERVHISVPILTHIISAFLFYE